MNPIVGAIAGVGAQAASNFFGARINADFNREEDDYARFQNYHYNELAASTADTRTRRLYTDLYSPKAQLEQIKSAGLSPSVFYGDASGISGQTGAMGAGAAGITPKSARMDPLDMSQVQLNLAQANKIKEETKTEAGENERGAAEIEKMIQETATSLAEQGNLEASTALTVLETKVTELTRQLKEATLYDDIDKVKKEVQLLDNENKKIIQETRSLRKQADFDEDMYDTKCAMFRNELKKSAQEVINLRWEANEKKINIKYVNRLIDKVGYDMQYMYYEMQLGQKENKLENLRTKWDIYFKEAAIQMGLRGQDVEMFQAKMHVITGILSAGITTSLVGSMLKKKM